MHKHSGQERLRCLANLALRTNPFLWWGQLLARVAQPIEEDWGVDAKRTKSMDHSGACRTGDSQRTCQLSCLAGES